MEERYELTIERIRKITGEETVAEPYREYFRQVAYFLLKIHEEKELLKKMGREKLEKEHLDAEMKLLYQDVLPCNYGYSYANPVYAAQKMGEEIGAFLSALYTELRAEIGYVYEGRLEYIAILNELFVEIYNRFEAEEEPELSGLKESFYWYASDYCDVFAADKVRETIEPERNTFARRVILENNLDNLRYLYQYGEYVGEKTWKRAEDMRSLSEDAVSEMADTYLETICRKLSEKKSKCSEENVIVLDYVLGMERIVRCVLQKLDKMGVKVAVNRTSRSLITKKECSGCGFYGESVNPQYELDHKEDIALVLDKQFVERRLEVIRTVLEQNKEQAAKVCGYVRIDNVENCDDLLDAQAGAIRWNEKQEELWKTLMRKEEQLVNQYMSSC